MNSSRIADVQMYSDFQKQRLALERGQRTKYFGGKGIETRATVNESADRVWEEKTKMSITFENDIADEGVENEFGLFDDDDPFNLPPPLPPLSPQRDDDPFNQNGDKDQTNADDKTEANKKRRVKRSPRPKLDEVR